MAKTDDGFAAFQDRLNKLPRQKYYLAQSSPLKLLDHLKMGRKVYENFYPHPTSYPVPKDNPGGTPEITGSDRVYALYQYALDNNLDFGRLLANDRQNFPDRTPNTLEFADTKFELNPGSIGGKHYGRNNNDWNEISTGTNYGNDIFELLAKENFK